MNCAHCLTVLIVNTFWRPRSACIRGPRPPVRPSRSKSGDCSLSIPIHRRPSLHTRLHLERKPIFAGWTGVCLTVMGRATRGRCSVRARERIEGVRRKPLARVATNETQHQLLMAVPCPARLREHPLLPSPGMGTVQNSGLLVWAGAGCRGAVYRSSNDWDMTYRAPHWLTHDNSLYCEGRRGFTVCSREIDSSRADSGKTKSKRGRVLMDICLTQHTQA